MLANTPAWAPVAVLGVAFMLYRRVRRQFGRQRYRPVESVVRLVVLGIAALLLCAAAAYVPRAAAPMAGGAIAGLIVGLAALRHTHVEGGPTAYYTPSPWIGAGLTLVILGRVVWRVASGGFTAGGAQPPPSPLTLGLVCVLVAYYLVYGVGLARQVGRLRGPVVPTA